ncbi:phosphogluconate dehydratase [Marinobacterium litorale]|uniref:phosphogluconate dehydratase n=1 Tax=Marinobacterium litorale TaxID=404770 RepID=UPI000407F3CD|nr:phosphogluconate dehydratase [Marinobacterium litorale]
MNPSVLRVTERIIERSRHTRSDYLARMDQARGQGVHRTELSCGNLAHGFAACAPGDKQRLKLAQGADIAIVSAYNDMLSAHQPLARFPNLIKEAVAGMGGVAQFAGGVPAMCDGVTQGQPGMELSLFSRDTIAMATAVALSHNMFDGVLCLGVCDKIVPGLLIGALSFGHLPVIFVPAGPMPSGLSNPEKARIRQLYAEGKVGRDALLECESQSYHAPGTCTFYGTANSNQLLMEVMGLHLPGTAFVNPDTPLRDALTQAAAEQVCRITALGRDYRPLCQVVDERALVNGLVALMATGGSTNHCLHMVAIARAAGVLIDWDDYAELSRATPLLTRIYPNGSADINHFQAAGGMALLIHQLLNAGLLHEAVMTVSGRGLGDYTREPRLEEGKLVWREGPHESLDTRVVADLAKPFAPDGGLKLLTGNLGRATMKVSAVEPEHRVVEAPAIVIEDQEALKALFDSGELERDFVLVVRFQGPAANGMPELHKLTPYLGVLQDKGFRVALVTDGRMSGASGKVPAAIHLTPEALRGGPLSRVREGDIIRVDGDNGTLAVKLTDDELNGRDVVTLNRRQHHYGMGRELFAGMRQLVTGAEQGACTLFADADAEHG